MKYATLAILLMVHLYAFNEKDVEQEIQTSKSIEELTTHMISAPKQFRQRYIQAIKERARIENEAKREQLMSDLNAEKSEDVQTQQINALTGRNSNANSSTGAGKGKGGSSGNGKGGGGGKGGK